ncbi:MAG: alpha/beta hydrolase [Proteobacteria bacterium]|nr:alpha/beta hydrolase [Pseudomonadota bacterium]
MHSVEIDGVALECQRIAATRDNVGSTLVFLHEGLGSVALWKRFPAAVAAATGCAALIYSRRGYGWSAPRAEPFDADYMHREAVTVLPRLFDRMGITHPVLVGHSDGASIAIIYAGSRCGPVGGLVLMAPHVFVEDATVASIAQAKTTYLTSDLRQRFARYHRDPDHSFWGWNDVWLAPAFRRWNIEAYVPAITVPMLVIQGLDDQYGTAAQYQAIQRLACAPCEVHALPDCRHSPHVDHPKATEDMIAGFIRRLTDAAAVQAL